MNAHRAPASLRWLAGTAPSALEGQRRSRIEQAHAALCASANPLEVDLLARLRRGNVALPVLPEVAEALLSWGSAPSPDLDELAHLATGDPVLCGRLIAAAEAQQGDGAWRARSARFAVRRLGGEAARNLSVRLAHASAVPPRRFLLELEEGRRRSQRCAAAAQSIALQLPPALGDYHAEGAHAVGLLQDLGEIRVWRLLATTQGDVGAEDARRLVARHHEAAGEDLARAWRLPAELVAACGAHHDTVVEESPTRRLAAASTAVVDAAQEGWSGAKLAALAALGMTSTDARRLVARFAPGRQRSD